MVNTLKEDLVEFIQDLKIKGLKPVTQPIKDELKEVVALLKRKDIRIKNPDEVGYFVAMLFSQHPDELINEDNKEKLNRFTEKVWPTELKRTNKPPRR